MHRLLLLVVLCLPCFAQYPQFQDWAGQSGTASGTSLAAGTHCAPGGSSWAQVPATGMSFTFVGTSGNTFQGNLNCSGTNYTGNSGVGFQVTWSSTSTSGFWHETISSSFAGGISVGMLWTPSVGSVAALAQIDTYRLNSHLYIQLCGSTSSTVCSESPGSNSYLLMCVEQSNPFSRSGCQQITNGSTYWITAENTSSGNDYVQIYNWSSAGLGSLLATISATDTAYTTGSLDLLYGDSGSATPQTASTITFANVITQYGPASFPVLPPVAPLWNGVLSPSRAISWQGAGVVGGIPSATWSQCVNTQCATVTSAGTSATTSQINAALQNAPANTYVLLGAGTYSGLGTIDFGGAKSNVVLRGAGANQTFLVFTSASGCNGAAASVCIHSTDTNYKGAISNGPVTWTASNYSQGNTTITLSSVPNLVVGNPIILDQQDSTSDTGSVLVTQSTSTGSFTSPGVAGPYSVQGNAGGPQRSGYQQFQVVTLTQCDGNSTVGHACSSGTNVTISPGLYMPNWSSGLNPSAWWATSPCTNDGVENLSLDNTNNANVIGIEIFNCTNSWVTGIRSIDTSYAHVQMQNVAHVTVRNNYFYLTQNWATSSYGVNDYLACDNLVENNIFQAIAAPLLNNGSCGRVDDYNYAINEFFNDSTFNANSQADHTSGVSHNLFEGNIGDVAYADSIHGSHNFQTHFRNYYTGPQVSCWISSTNTATSVTALATATFGTCLSSLNPIADVAFSRFYNYVGNVLGTTSVNSTYQVNDSTNNAAVYMFGWGDSPVVNDPNVLTTSLRWGNVDSATGFSTSRWCGSTFDTGWGPTCSSTAEIPLFASLASSQQPYANALPSLGDTTAGQPAMPASFIYSAAPSWWPATKAWPPIGPDVSSGNVSGVGGHVYSIPAQDCYTNVMGGPSNGTGTVLTFNAAQCYPTVTVGPAPAMFAKAMFH